LFSFALSGQPWCAGDVIGVTLDADAGEVAFARNGTHMGVAFSGIRTTSSSASSSSQAGLAYYPALSLSQGEAAELEFGTLPLMYPLPGFQARPSCEESTRHPLGKPLFC
jgi:hypothetical protein